MDSFDRMKRRQLLWRRVVPWMKGGFVIAMLAVLVFLIWASDAMYSQY